MHAYEAKQDASIVQGVAEQGRSMLRAYNRELRLALITAVRSRCSCRVRERANVRVFRRRTWTSNRALLWFRAARSDTRRRAARLRRRGAARRLRRGAELDGTWPCRSIADRACW